MVLCTATNTLSYIERKLAAIMMIPSESSIHEREKTHTWTQTEELKIYCAFGIQLIRTKCFAHNVNIKKVENTHQLKIEDGIKKNTSHRNRNHTLVQSNTYQGIDSIVDYIWCWLLCWRTQYIRFYFIHSIWAANRACTCTVGRIIHSITVYRSAQLGQL